MNISNRTKRFFNQLYRFYFAIVGGCLIVAYSVYLWFPNHIYFIIQEDHLVENISAFSYLLAFFLGLWILKKYDSWRKITWLVAIVGLIGFLDELSFGTRIIEVTQMEILGENIDALHDFIIVGYIFFDNILGFYGLLFFVLATITSVIFLFNKQQKYHIKDFIGDPFTAPGLFFALFFFFVLSAQIADLKGFIAPLIILEELFEMFGGIALSLYSISLDKMLQEAKITKHFPTNTIIESNVVELEMHTISEN